MFRINNEKTFDSLAEVLIYIENYKLKDQNQSEVLMIRENDINLMFCFVSKYGRSWGAL